MKLKKLIYKLRHSKYRSIDRTFKRAARIWRKKTNGLKMKCVNSNQLDWNQTTNSKKMRRLWLSLSLR